MNRKVAMKYVTN